MGTEFHVTQYMFIFICNITLIKRLGFFFPNICHFPPSHCDICVELALPRMKSAVGLNHPKMVQVQVQVSSDIRAKTYNVKEKQTHPFT